MTTSPQDHKQPKDKPQTVTIQGVTLTIDPAIFDDLDMTEHLYNLQHAAEDPEGSFDIVPFLRKLCGPAYPQVKQALRDPETRRIPLESVSAFITDLMQGLAPNS